MSQLLRFRGVIESGKAVWAPLSTAIVSLRSPRIDDGQARQQLAAAERSNRVLSGRLVKQLQAAHTVREALLWDEWAELNPDKVVGD